MVDLSPTEEVVRRALATYTEAVDIEKLMLDTGLPEGSIQSAFIALITAGFIQELS